MALAGAYDSAFAEKAVVIVDDSHGVGAFGATGRGTEEYTGAASADLLVATLGKAFGVNGGYVAGEETIIRYLARDVADLHLFEPDHAGRGRRRLQAVDIVDSAGGVGAAGASARHHGAFQSGARQLGFETLPGTHPVVPLMLRDTARTSAWWPTCAGTAFWHRPHLPVVPKGDEEIRFQISADHTLADIDAALEALADVAA